MASTQIGIIKNAAGVIKMVVNPTTDAGLDQITLAPGETMLKLSRSTYNTYHDMRTLASAQGLSIT